MNRVLTVPRDLRGAVNTIPLRGIVAVDEFVPNMKNFINREVKEVE